MLPKDTVNYYDYYERLHNRLYNDPIQTCIISTSERQNSHQLSIKKVIFHDPATIVYWTDGTKTVVRAKNEAFDPEKGLAMACAKKLLGNKGHYFQEFKKWVDEKQ